MVQSQPGANLGCSYNGSYSCLPSRQRRFNSGTPLHNRITSFWFSHRKVPSHRHGQHAAAPGSKRLHTSVISRCLNLNPCTRHQYKYMYHISGCRLHHEFILLLCQVSSMAEQPFCKRQVVGLTPPPGSTVPVHTGASWFPAPVKSGVRGGLSLRQISG